MASDFDIHIGTRELWGGGKTPFGLSDVNAFQHVWLNGQTGVDKSAVLLSMFAQVVRNGHGCTLIDLNGDLADQALNCIPLSRRGDVVICDPTDAQHVLPINPFHQIPPDERSRVASDFTKTCEKIWEDSWGDRMDWILRNVVAAILDAPEKLRPTILSIPLMLTNKIYQKEMINHIQYSDVARFFKDEFLRWPKTKRGDFIMPIENKIGKLISNHFVRNMLSPYQPKFQFRDAITNKSILIVRLSKGTLGEEPTALLGSLTVSTIINAAMEQAAIAYEDRIPHYLLIDEQHILKTYALTSGYSEARKYKLPIISATQYTDQLDDDLIASMFGNVGTVIAFRSSAFDADRFAKQIGEFQAHEYTQLSLGEVRVRLLRDGQIVMPFRASTSIDHLKPVNKSSQIRQFVRERYTRPRSEVEHNYKRWMRKLMIDPANKRQQRKPRVQKPLHSANQPSVPTPLPAAGTISARGAKASSNIKAIANAARERNCAFNKPTRRKLRRTRQDLSNK